VIRICCGQGSEFHLAFFAFFAPWREIPLSLHQYSPHAKAQKMQRFAKISSSLLSINREAQPGFAIDESRSFAQPVWQSF
jgi:hypothetical protein